jgi:ring-1,2-phenylacetyl-CoA epoxidase subunit PaaD
MSATSTHVPQQHAAIWAALSAITDPEIPVVSLAELGILRDVRVAEDGVTEVVITPTYSGCPAMGQIEDDVRQTLQAHGLQARVLTQLSPAWTTDWMSDEAKAKLRAYGIAPPVRRAQDAPQSVQLLRRRRTPDQVPCPQCGSDNTTEITAFGSTACKAQYRCLDCLEPFDYFKPY